MLFQSILVLFFLRFWLKLETTSRWVGSEFSFHWCCFPRRWFAVNSLCSSWFQDLVFGDLTSRLFFIAWGWLHGLLISFCLFYLFVLSSRCTFHRWSRLWWLSLSPNLLLQVWIVCFFVYALCAWKVVYGLKLKLWFLGGWLSFSPTQIVIFFSCIPWCRCAVLVF